MRTQQCHDNTIGCDSRFRSNLTLADANPPGSWVNNTPFRHQVDSQECLQPPDPAPCHRVLKTRTDSQLVWGTSESLATVSVIVPTRVTIAVQPSLANGLHIARSHTFREKATRYLLIALQPRHVEAPQPAWMESNHSSYDSTAQSRQRIVTATRYPLSFIRHISLSITIQLRIISSPIFRMKTGISIKESVA